MLASMEDSFAAWKVHLHTFEEIIVTLSIRLSLAANLVYLPQWGPRNSCCSMGINMSISAAYRRHWPYEAW